MTRLGKLVVVFSVLIAGLLFVNQSRAAIITGDTVTTDIATWTNNQVLNQDKLYTLISTNLPTNTQAKFQLLFPGPTEFHNLTLTPVGELFNPPLAVYSLVYTVSITDPERCFSNVRLSANVDHDVVTVTKLVVGDGVNHTLTVVGSAQQDFALPFSPFVKFLTVTETIDVGPVHTGALASVSNQFTEVVVPEPSTLLVWSGLGAMGLVIAWRRRNRAV
jgi:hypothetical protein